MEKQETYPLRSRSSRLVPLPIFLPVLDFPESSGERLCLEELVVCNQQEGKAALTPSSPEPEVLSLTFLTGIIFD